MVAPWFYWGPNAIPNQRNYILENKHLEVVSLSNCLSENLDRSINVGKNFFLDKTFLWVIIVHKMNNTYET